MSQPAVTRASGAAPLPHRLLARHLNAMQHDMAVALSRAASGSSDRMMLLLAIMRERLRRHDGPLCSVHALAVSFDRPFETVRRHVRELMKAGLLVHDGHGYCPTDAPVVTALRDGLDAAVLAMIAGLEQHDIALTDDGRPYDAPRPARLALALDLMLAIVSVEGPHRGNWTTLKLLGGIQTLNVRGIMADPALDRRYAHNPDVPPDNLRRPVTLAELAARFGLSHTTVWRHVRTLEQAGALKKAGNGWIAPDSWFARPDQQRITRQLVENAVARIRASAR